MKQYIVDCMLSFLNTVYCISVYPCASVVFVSILWPHALRKNVYTYMSWLWYMYTYYHSQCLRLVPAYTSWLKYVCLLLLQCSATCSASKCIVNVCNNTLLHAFNFVGRYIYVLLIWTSHIYICDKDFI